MKKPWLSYYETGEAASECVDETHICSIFLLVKPKLQVNERCFFKQIFGYENHPLVESLKMKHHASFGECVLFFGDGTPFFLDETRPPFPGRFGIAQTHSLIESFGMKHCPV